MPLHNPLHHGKPIRECLEVKGWTVSECASRRRTLSRLLDGRAGFCRQALAPEEFGWSDARYWVRMQASYDLARERCKRAVEIPATPGGPL